MLRLLAAASLAVSASALDQHGWVSLTASLQNGATESNGVVVLAPAWPPQYVSLPPIYASDGPLTIVAWVNPQQSGTVVVLGNGIAGAPVLEGPHIALWDDGATWGASSSCSLPPPIGGWSVLGVSFDGELYTFVRGDQTCTAAAGPLPAAWWFQAMLGGAGFSGHIAQVSIFDDTALSAEQMITGACGPRPSPAPEWQSGVAATAWASTSGIGCVDSDLRRVGACNAMRLVTGPPGSSFFQSAGGADTFPFVALDLGTSQLVSSVRVYGATDGYDANPSASYRLMVMDMRPPRAGTPSTSPFGLPACGELAPPSVPRGRVFDVTCGAFGRYVVLQLVDGGVLPGVIKLSQIVVSSSSASRPPETWSPGRNPPDAPAAVWDVSHRYGPAGVRGGYVVDSGNDAAIYGPSRGVTQSVGGRGLVFSGDDSCVTFQPWSVASQFSIVTTFTTPSAAPAFTSAVLIRMGDAQLQLRVNGTSGVSTPTLTRGSSVFSGKPLLPNTRTSLAVTCSSTTACSILS